MSIESSTLPQLTVRQMERCRTIAEIYRRGGYDNNATLVIRQSYREGLAAGIALVLQSQRYAGHAVGPVELPVYSEASL